MDFRFLGDCFDCIKHFKKYHKFLTIPFLPISYFVQSKIGDLECPSGSYQAICRLQISVNFQLGLMQINHTLKIKTPHFLNVTFMRSSTKEAINKLSNFKSRFLKMSIKLLFAQNSRTTQILVGQIIIPKNAFGLSQLFRKKG